MEVLLLKLIVFVMNALVITRTSFCCTKKLKKLHLFLTKVAKSCIYSQTLKRTMIYSSDLFTYTVIPRYIALHLSRLRCFAEFFTVLFCTVDSDWLRGVTVVLNLGKDVIIIIIIIFIYLPSDVMSQEKTASSSRSITKASKYAIPLKPSTQTCRVKAIFSHLVRRQRRTERSSKSIKKGHLRGRFAEPY